MIHTVLLWAALAFVLATGSHAFAYRPSRWSIVAGLIAAAVVALGALYVMSGQVYDKPRLRP